MFALPLLLAMDTWAEPLFQSVLLWEFRCDECSAATAERWVLNLSPKPRNSGRGLKAFSRYSSLSVEQIHSCWQNIVFYECGDILQPLLDRNLLN